MQLIRQKLCALGLAALGLAGLVFSAAPAKAQGKLDATYGIAGRHPARPRRLGDRYWRRPVQCGSRAASRRDC